MATPGAAEVLADDFDDPLVSRIVAFLRQIGIPVEVAALEDETFLPGVLVAGGGLRVDPSRLAWPGDLLHEAGHVAVGDPACRDDGVSDDPGEEMAALAWSFAAATHLGLDPSVPFHEGGYRGWGPTIAENFSEGGYVGVPMLAMWGLTHEPRRAKAIGARPYPHMLAWRRT
ncbi:hypothetical protein ASD21_15305 [Caulobacter sp. Root1455]|uniref:hypothetical protein n=1 Tax=unclassified Caulobacter TaxID=2648921 RepID=UPI0006F6B390|nr:MULTISPECIES: hypothetical protein [unclassified Caulobacter]KQY27406.1 hypothetical protein ASD38_18715 [Caulobacter sp. Root487D2Y]KQY92737.1 hypothetical protein ASD21_15305 [Caulobacter sp. Root1455]